MMMDYTQTLEYLFSQLPMFSRIGAAAYKKDLTNTIALCAHLGNPQHKIKTLHIAGTNGKGSTSHMLAAIFQQAGYKTGLYTSPHLKDFRERIKINGEMIPEEKVISFTHSIREKIIELHPSFFEITVAMAFDHFAQEEVDIAIIETGLGGRLDSTNIITPLLSIITNIGFDHQNMLGNRLEDIAGEKAGIIKYKIPVIIGELLPETAPVFTQKSEEMEAPLYAAEEKIKILDHDLQDEFLHITVEDLYTKELLLFQLDLNGYYQVKNFRSVLLACYLLKDQFPLLTVPQIQLAIKKVKNLTGLLGRFDIWQKNPLVIIDVAHNSDGLKTFLESVAKIHSDQLQYQSGKLHIVLGMVKDKEIDAALEQLPQKATYYFTAANIPRALSKESLQQQAKQHSLQGSLHSDVNTALDAALSVAGEWDTVLVCGSIFLIGELQQKL